MEGHGKRRYYNLVSYHNLGVQVPQPLCNLHHTVRTTNIRQHLSPMCPFPSCLIQLQKQSLLLYLEKEHIQFYPQKMLEIRLKCFAESR